MTGGNEEAEPTPTGTPHEDAARELERLSAEIVGTRRARMAAERAVGATGNAGNRDRDGDSRP
jgi:hypothetical protein